MVGFLDRHGQSEAEAAAQRLKTLAGQVLDPVPELSSCWQNCLYQHLRQYESLDQSIHCLEQAMARQLAQSSGALLTSISGIGVVLAAGIVGELGEGRTWRPVRSWCSYAGVLPRITPTGGPDQPAQTGPVQRRCNRRAKNWLVQAGSSMGKCGPAELMAQHEQLQRNGQHANFIMSKRLLRIFKDLAAASLGWRPEVITAELRGGARDAARMLAQTALRFQDGMKPGERRCLLWGGETTVTVKGSGAGGRNQELALAFAIATAGRDGITLLSAGTDGTDGPTDAAGAVVDGSVVTAARNLGIHPEVYVDNNDSYAFFRRLDALTGGQHHLMTGPTGTNVMDIQVILIER